MPAAQARILANIAWSCAQLRCRDHPLLQAISGAAVRKSTEFTSYGLSNIAWAYAKLKCADGPLMDSISSAALKLSAGEFSPQELANIAWSYAKLDIGNGPLLEVISAASRRRMPEFFCQGLANMAWSFATLGVEDVHLLDAIAGESVARISELNPQELTNPAWAYATLAFEHQPLLEPLAGAALRSIAAFQVQELANMAWALAKLEIRDAPLMNAIASRSVDSINKFTSQGLTNLSWAVARLKMEDTPLMAAISAAAVAKIGDFSPQGLANTVWSFAHLREGDAPCIDVIAASALRTQPGAAAPDISGTAGAFSELPCAHQPLLDAISAQAIRSIAEFAAQALANTAWAFARLSVADCPLFAVISAASVPTLGEFDFQMLSTTAWAYAELDVDDAPLLDAIAAEARSRLEAARSAGLASELSPLAVLATTHALAEAQRLDSSFLEEASAVLQAIGTGLDTAARAEADDGLGTVAPSSSRSAAAGDGEDGRPFILCDSRDVCVIWKPPGWITIPADHSAEEGGDLGDSSDPDGASGPTLTGFAAEHLGADHPVALDARVQNGLVHRLDRDTSGAVCCAKTYLGYYLAVLQFSARRVQKEYACLCRGLVPPARCMIETPLRTVRRLGQYRSVAAPNGRRARTEILGSTHLRSPEDGSFLSLVHVRLHTGRMHQIRAHMASHGHPLVGDPSYGGPTPSWCPRVFLHAARLRLELGCPGDEGLVDAAVPLPADLATALAGLAPCDGRARGGWQSGSG